ncbi:putative calmodulin-regulated spectrin-associated protein [Plasmopara halstedii]
MNTKYELAQTASLASCLYFAAQVLCSTAPVQDTCTKSVLAAIVVEAHKCGQVAKRSKVSPSIDIRKLLTRLQSEQSNKSCPLVNLNVADLTWDFEGVVADTLAMEIGELQDRATSSAINVCVVLTVTCQLLAGGHSVIWFPPESLCSFGSKKRQILLYVYPGRVKVVKSTNDLIKVMYDELPVLREKRATYNVRAVILGSKSQNQQDEERDFVRLSGLQEHPENQKVIDSTPMPTKSLNDSTMRRSSVHNTDQLCFINPPTDKFTENNNNPKMIAACSTHIDDFAATIPEPRNDENDDVSSLLSQSSSFPDHTEVMHTEAYLTSSIFSFAFQQQNLTEPQGNVSGQLNNNFCGAPSITKAEVAIKMEFKGAPVNRAHVEDVSSQRQIIQPRRTFLSSSLANLTTVTKEKLFEADLGSNLVAHGVTWQSYDSKVFRKTALPQQRAKSPGSNVAKMKDLAATASCNVEDKQIGLVLDQHKLKSQFEKESDGQHGQLYDDSGSTNEFNADKRLECDKVQPEQHEPCTYSSDKPVQHVPCTYLPDQADTRSSYGCFSSSTSPDTNSIETTVSISRALGEGFTCDSEGVDDAFLNNMNDEAHAVDTSNISVPNSDKDIASDSDEDVVSDSDEKTVLAVQTAAVDMIKQTQSLKLRSAEQKPISRSDYRDKLGPQIWWELEYTAKKLEREEMMERRQQQHNRHRQDDYQDGKCAFTRNIRLAGSQEMKHSRLNNPREEKSVDLNYELHDSRNLTHTEASQPAQIDTFINDEDEFVSFDTIANDSADDRDFKLQNERTVPSFESQTDKLDAGLLEGFLEQKSNISLSQRNDVDYLVPASVLKSREDSYVVCTSTTNSSALVPSLPDQPIEVNLMEPKQQQLLGTSPVHCAFVERSFIRPQITTFTSATPVASNNMGVDDERLTQLMLTSTNRDSKSFSSPAKKEDLNTSTSNNVSAIPFTVRGRVPIRSRNCSASSELLSFKQSPTYIGSNHSSVKSKVSTTASPSDHFASACLHHRSPARKSAPIATFVPLENSAVASRELKLNELRQKKLQKLQQARSLALQQQNGKQRLRRPLSFASSCYTKKASNRQLIQNALEFTLLAGGSMENDRTLALQALAESTCDNFIVLLKSAKELKFRALYEAYVDRDSATRIFSLLPSTSSRAPLRIGNSEMIAQFFKYSSAKKQFLPVPTRSFTIKTDACALVDQHSNKGSLMSR